MAKYEAKGYQRGGRNREYDIQCKCLNCQQIFFAARYDARYCSDACRKNAWKKAKDQASRIDQLNELAGVIYAERWQQLAYGANNPLNEKERKQLQGAMNMLRTLLDLDGAPE